MHGLPYPARSALDAHLHHLPRNGRLLEVPAPDVEGMLELPQGAFKALLGRMLCMPLAEGGVRKRKVHTPRQWRDLHELP
jgi:hypothetical protein